MTAFTPSDTYVPVTDHRYRELVPILREIDEQEFDGDPKHLAALRKKAKAIMEELEKKGDKKKVKSTIRIRDFTVMDSKTVEQTHEQEN